ncbi:hypothetical protein BDB00DRAFT_935162 [Zychaea mexicana]|uniref:uncharacterized protein n=1 Tax=Zychaea mexicana TaxID=64656 RepID=UPI0022FE1D26|nr:uncharacterized protein BDB00DRAFT_935162 [Zychaea mexicana]KAI9498893.1 hypothetical protein BDB00DRAFT_935162 [Zychaea mexicana]
MTIVYPTIDRRFEYQSLISRKIFVQAAILELEASEFKLFGKPGHYEDLIAKLDDELPNVTVAEVVRNTNHPCLPYDGPSVNIRDYTWDKKDGYNDIDTTKWYPQGVTSSSDAYDKGTYGENNMMLISWYDHTTKSSDPANKGVRISFVEMNSNQYHYRNVLLVVPYETTAGVPSFHSVKIHAGGIMWYGNLLYVVDTANGIRIFDLSHIYEVSIGDGIGHVGSGRYEGANYKYVLPQWGHYLAYSDVAKDFAYSFISLDRTTIPDSFVMGQYNSSGVNNRIVRFDIDYETRLPVHSSGTYATATEFYYVGLKSMQGATSITKDGVQKYYFSCSRGNRTNGDLYTWDRSTGDLNHYEGILSVGPEDLAYRQQGDQLWTLGEHPGERPVYALSASAY